jgi:hypothetical protein
MWMCLKAVAEDRLSFLPHHLRSLSGPEQPGEFSTLVQDHGNAILDLPDLPENRREFYTSAVYYQRWLNEQVAREEPDAPEINLVVQKRRGARRHDPALTVSPPWEFVYTNRLIYRNVSSRASDIPSLLCS